MIKTQLAALIQSPVKGVAGESHSHSAAYVFNKFSTSGDWHCPECPSGRLFQRAFGRGPCCRSQYGQTGRPCPPARDHRPVHRQTQRYPVLHRLSLWLGLEGAGCAQQHSRALHHPRRSGDPLRRTFKLVAWRRCRSTCSGGTGNIG